MTKSKKRPTIQTKATSSPNIHYEITEEHGEEIVQPTVVINKPKSKPKSKPKHGKMAAKSTTSHEQYMPPITNIILHLKCCLNDLNQLDNQMGQSITDPLEYSPIVPPEIEIHVYKVINMHRTMNQYR